MSMRICLSFIWVVPTRLLDYPLIIYYGVVKGG